ncbi:CD1375 family protein [Peptostreptococcus faecalis]|uniref:CD1375 family protein n=1 Tax=Peptostreptococcus faecalis TaxID=2045015 RepID=UPI000C7DB2A0|nr:CD1375 family protein [Peptostreptococcus faecalis]
MKDLINKIRFFFLLLKLAAKGGERDMAMCYVTCIVHGYRTYSQVPVELKEEVKELLIGTGLERLVTE